MISSRPDELPVDEDGTRLYMVDIGRPDILGETIDKWRTFHDWVESGPVEIVISDVYGAMAAYSTEGHYYLGEGLKYCFWFFTEEDKETFVIACEEMHIL